MVMLYLHIESVQSCPWITDICWIWYCTEWIICKRGVSLFTAISGFGGHIITWWCHQMETISALLALCARNSPLTGEFPHKGQWRGALVFSLIFALNKQLSKQSWSWSFETLSRWLWYHCNESMFVSSCFVSNLLGIMISGIKYTKRNYPFFTTTGTLF